MGLYDGIFSLFVTCHAMLNGRDVINIYVTKMFWQISLLCRSMLNRAGHRAFAVSPYLDNVCHLQQFSSHYRYVIDRVISAFDSNGLSSTWPMPSVNGFPTIFMNLIIYYQLQTMQHITCLVQRSKKYNEWDLQCSSSFWLFVKPRYIVPPLYIVPQLYIVPPLYTVPPFPLDVVLSLPNCC